MELKAQDVETVEFAARLEVVAGHVAIKPVVGLTTEPKPTVPAKLKTLVRVTGIAAPVAPELKLTGVPTLMVKSPT